MNCSVILFPQLCFTGGTEQIQRTRRWCPHLEEVHRVGEGKHEEPASTAQSPRRLTHEGNWSHTGCTAEAPETHRPLVRDKTTEVEAVVSGCVKVGCLERCRHAPNSPKALPPATSPGAPGVFQRPLGVPVQRENESAHVLWEQTGSIFKIKQQLPSPRMQDGYKGLMPQRLAINQQIRKRSTKQPSVALIRSLCLLLVSCCILNNQPRHLRLKVKRTSAVRAPVLPEPLRPRG